MLEPPALSPRVARLSARLEQRLAAMEGRVYCEPAEAQALGEALLAGYRATPGKPPILRRAAALQAFAERFPIVIDPDEPIVGRQTFNAPWCAPDYPAAQLAELGYAATTGHIVHDYARLLQEGIDGLRHELAASARTGRTEAQQLNAQAFDEALSAFALFIRRHADASGAVGADLEALTATPPATFHQALQLVWFAQVFLHAENPSMAISFGRLDQYLWPFLERDLHAGRLTEDEAFDLVCAFCLKCCEGEESQNLVLGGADEAGEDQGNLLSLLVLEAVAALRCPQPSLTVRWHPRMPERLRTAACLLSARGGGQPGFMNDAVVAAALEAAGIPAERARDWAVVGCYEAVPQGDCYANTVLGGLHLPETLSTYLATATSTAFAAFVEGWFDQLRAVYAQELTRLQGVWDHLAARAPSPFGSALMGGCAESLTPLEAGGGRFSLVGINLLGLGTLVDSLHAIRTLVYEQNDLTLEQLSAAVQGDFPDEALRARLRNLPGRYGTDDPATNELAASLSERLARLVLDSRLAGGVRPYPAFFRFSADIYDLRVASADGRRSGDLISYGVGPSAGAATTATAVLASAAHVAHDLCACGNPLALTLPQPPLPPVEGARLIATLVDTYFGQGGFHLHFNQPSAADLRAAQQRPHEHEDLMVRVSGFSARFVHLDPRWQAALIERAESGL